MEESQGAAVPCTPNRKSSATEPGRTIMVMRVWLCSAIMTDHGQTDRDRMAIAYTILVCNVLQGNKFKVTYQHTH